MQTIDCTMNRKHTQMQGRMFFKSTQMPETTWKWRQPRILPKKKRTGETNNLLSIDVQ